MKGRTQQQQQYFNLKSRRVSSFHYAKSCKGSLLKKLCWKHFSTQIEINKFNLIKTWKVMNTIIGSKCEMSNSNTIHNSIKTNDSEISTLFNMCVTEIGLNLSKIIRSNVDHLWYIHYLLVVFLLHNFEKQK